MTGALWLVLPSDIHIADMTVLEAQEVFAVAPDVGNGQGGWMDKLGQHPTTSSVEMGGSTGVFNTFLSSYFALVLLPNSWPIWAPSLPRARVCAYGSGRCRRGVGGRVGGGPSVLVAGSCWR